MAFVPNERVNWETEYALNGGVIYSASRTRASEPAFFRASTMGGPDIVTHGIMQRRDAADQQYKLRLDFQRVTVVARVVFF